MLWMIKMILEIIGILLMAFGFYVLHQAIEKGREDRDVFLLLIVSIITISFGGIIFIKSIEFGLLIKRLVGLLSLLFGIFLVTIFPGTGYTYRGFKNLGIFLGLIISLFGVYLLFS